ncbi:PEBP family protein [Aestuariibius sp. 2305UL40-4]|uniref:PEBP family protein n=1 Tax=Aestuariibius violaceus TaxID=3234132 RepID=UPI00345E0BB1
MRLIPIAMCLTALGPTTLRAETFQADVWADNWFEMRIDGIPIAEDSVPITTERSFNAESFAFEAERPFTIGLVARDFIEDDTGLEYIGTRRQQMGDGGVILQIVDAAGRPVALSGADWLCQVIHAAPLDPACAAEASPVAGEGACGFDIAEEPDGWDLPGSDASDWPQATIYSPAAVDPKDGYDRIAWSPEAQFIWGPDLKRDNTILCRLTVE